MRADHLNVGTATVLLHRTDTGREKVWHPRVGPNPSAPGGLLVFASGMLRCSGAPNAYFAVRDPTSGRWSARVQRQDGLLDALRGRTPRRAAGLAGEGPAALRDAWFRQQRGGMALPGQGRGGRLVALSRVEEGASVSRLEGLR